MLFAHLVSSGNIHRPALAFIIGAVMMIIGGVVQLIFGIKAEGQAWRTSLGR